MSAVFIFPGQGSQSVGMGREIYENCAKARELLESASEFCKIDFKNLLFEENEKLNLSEFTQPAIVLNSLMSYLLLKEMAPNIDDKLKFSLGHSLGEFSALAISGAFEFNEAINLVHQRGKFMQEDCSKIEAAMMVILGLDDEKVEQICQKAQGQNEKIYAANYNCDGQIVVAGLKNDLLKYESVFKEAGAKRAMLLNMSVASHCPLLENASKALTNELEKVLKANFKSVISNANAAAYSSKSEALTLLKNQLIKPVLYKQSIKNIENECDFFVEFGAKILAGLNKKITSKPTYSLTTPSEIETFVKTLA